ncbi:hypothetical protein DSO57_1024597 [Entomophthora muscae]|uniref:Uncharacterized protein n=1 Tax=Entomophthora muscae TaxID=34485 RepID=A0ACC2TPU5_9FUNG|nr:hypothetical protein DSO57_1024597 [Entomophthora muscae]
MMKCMPFHVQEFYVVADSYCNKYPWLNLDLKVSHFATLSSLNEVEVIDDLIQLWVSGFSELVGKQFTKEDVYVHTCFRNNKRNYHLILKSVKSNIATVFASMAQENIFSSQAFCLHGASKNDSPPFCLRFCHDPTYDPTIEEILDAFPLVLHGTETTFVPDLKSWNLSLGVFSSNPPPIQIASVKIQPPTSQAAPNSFPLSHS